MTARGYLQTRRVLHVAEIVRPYSPSRVSDKVSIVATSRTLDRCCVGRPRGRRFHFGQQDAIDLHVSHTYE